MTYLFIYGTLRKGCRAHRYMNEAKFLGRGTLAGKLYYIDRYPGLVDSTEGNVVGEIYEVDDVVLASLDNYEGCFEDPPHYTRETREVLFEDGELREVQTYIFRQLDESHSLLNYDDWCRFIEDNPHLNS